MKKIIMSAAIILLTVCLLLTGVQAMEPEGRYDPAREGIVSSYYAIDSEQGFVTGIAPGTPTGDLLKVCLPKCDTDAGEILATGDRICMPEALGNHSLTVIVTGDVNGDSKVSITDMLMIKNHILGQALTGGAAVAGDVNYDSKVTITDFLRVKSNLLGLESIGAGWPEDWTAQDTLILMQPGASEPWGVEAVAYESDDTAVAQVDAAGSITAGTEEGSAFVYALDAEGQVLRRAVVTVMEEGLTVTLEGQEKRMQPGQELTLIPRFNHPARPTVTWSSSDPAVVTVTEGIVTAHSMGTATVTAALPNGSTAQIGITVAPPITGLAFDRSLYKVKPGAERTLGLLAEPADTGEVFLFSSSDPAIATVADDGTVTGVKYGTVTVTAEGKYSGLKATCQVKICDVKQVAITFDDGPSGQTTKLLDFLKEKDVKATFFLVGNRISSYESTVKRQVAEGHEMGYHSYAHQSQTGLSSEKIKSDFEKSNDQLKALTGAEFTVWRTPGGAYNSRVLNCVELPHIFWSVDTRDWESLNANSVYRHVVSSQDGDIILLHDLYGSSVEGAIRAVKEMLAGDYEFLTVTELLSRDGTPPENCKTYFNG